MKYLLRLGLIVLALSCLLSAPSAQALSAVEKQAFEQASKKQWSQALATARNGGRVLRDLITWQYLISADSGASFDEGEEFLRTHPHWPDQKRLILRTEQALKNGLPPLDKLKSWFAQNPPVTGLGKWLQAEIILGENPPPQQIEEANWQLRDAWRNGDYDEPSEQKLFTRHGRLFTTADHQQRIDRLLWEGRTTAALRVLPLVSTDHQALYTARMALMNDEKKIREKLALVPQSLAQDAGLMFERLRWNVRQGNNNAVRDILLNTPAMVPYEDKWWRYREIATRRALDEQDYERAEKLLKGHMQKGGPEFADATWLSGWIALRFRNNPQKALEHFIKLYENVNFPVSLSRAAYWAGRASEKMGDAQSARQWYQKSARHPTYFYGQMALEKLGHSSISLPAAPQISDKTRTSFFASDIVKAALLAIDADAKDTANFFINHLIENANSSEEVALATEIGQKANRMYFGVRAAKRALQRGDVLIDAGYPIPTLKGDMGVEMPLILAIARQESEFDPLARSPAGALGLTQLLYGTAKETARRNDIHFERRRLNEMSYNAQLGSLYLARLVRIFNNSYIMAAGAYNAGPGRMREWESRFGTPGKNVEDAIDWIEKIPYPETRNYVQRVMENYQVYRYLLANREGRKAPLTLGATITR